MNPIVESVGHSLTRSTEFMHVMLENKSLFWKISVYDKSVPLFRIEYTVFLHEHFQS